MTINGRPTDHAFQSSSEEGGTENVTLDSYWDKATGVPVNVTQIDSVTGQGVTLDMNYVLVATNAWTTAVPEFSPEIMVIIMTVLVGVAGANARRRKESSLPPDQTSLNAFEARALFLSLSLMRMLWLQQSFFVYSP